MCTNKNSKRRSRIYSMLNTISLISLSIVTSSALAAFPPLPSGGQSPTTKSLIDLSSVFSANTSVMQTLFSQPDSVLATIPQATNHTIDNEFNGAESINLLANQNSSSLVSEILNKFHANYSQQSAIGSGAPVDPSTVTSDSIISADKDTPHPVYDGTSVHMVSSKYNPNDDKFNLAAIISQDILNTGPTKGVTERQLLAQGDALCTSMSLTLVNPDQSYSDNLDTGQLTQIASDPVLTQALLEDKWSKPDDPSSDAVENSSSSDASSKSDTIDPSKIVASNGMYEPYGKPYWNEFTSTIHQTTAIKSLGYATIYKICMERIPRIYKDASGKDIVESSVQHLHDTTNLINDPKYIKTIQSQSLNANIQEMIKAQRQTIQMLSVLHNDNEAISANLATISLMSVSGQVGSGAEEVNREMSAIIAQNNN